MSYWLSSDACQWGERWDLVKRERSPKCEKIERYFGTSYLLQLYIERKVYQGY